MEHNKLLGRGDPLNTRLHNVSPLMTIGRIMLWRGDRTADASPKVRGDLPDRFRHDLTYRGGDRRRNLRTARSRCAFQQVSSIRETKGTTSRRNGRHAATKASTRVNDDLSIRFLT